MFTTPYDETAVDFLEKLNSPIYKIASFEMTDLNLVKKVSKTKKPIIISTGMANLEEIETTFKIAKKNGVKIVQQKIPVPIKDENEFNKAFFKGITKKTKVIFISQITSPTALIFPMKKIMKYAKSNDIITIVDGAHVPGHIELNIHNLGCDFYTGAIHK